MNFDGVCSLWGETYFYLLFFPFMWGFMVTRGVEWGKSLGPEVFLCVE